SSSTSDNSNEASVQSDDQARFSNATDAVANDADLALELSPSFSGRLDRSQITFCNAAAVFDSVSNPRTITITYNGADCWGATSRTGVVVLSMAQGIHWKDAGAAITITYQNLKITRISDNKSIILNGSQTYTNVNGGLLINLPTIGTITHTITSGNMSVTFEDNTQRTWQEAKQRVFTYNSGVVITITGTHTDGSNTNIAEWGTNRLGHTFASSTVQPIVIRQDCSFRIVSGEIKHVTSAVTVTATFGLDASGNPTACPGAGHYYLEIVWTGPRGNSLTAILPY
ncbi:MAG TPA: hypothetical protein VGG71_04115, partial [Chitinophagaceae bacterium]